MIAKKVVDFSLPCLEALNDLMNYLQSRLSPPGEQQLEYRMEITLVSAARKKKSKKEKKKAA